MLSLDRVRPTDLKFLKRGPERLLVVAFCGDNRPTQYVEYQQKVFAHFALPINYVQVNFSQVTHGSAIDCFLNGIGPAYDYLILFDTDAIPLKSDFLDACYEKTRDHRTLFGIAQQSNHIAVRGSKNHVYVGPGALAISRKMHLALGRPSFRNSPRSDTAEELTWKAEELGYTVALIFPSHVHQRLWDLGNGHSFGIGTTYGESVFHAFLQTQEESRELFVRKCREILKRPRLKPGRLRAPRDDARDLSRRLGQGGLVLG